MVLQVYLVSAGNQIKMVMVSQKVALPERSISDAFSTPGITYITTTSSRHLFIEDLAQLIYD
ncbi:MAG: hypothetical protein ACLT33_03890 [Lachnospira pectinoschiza]